MTLDEDTASRSMIKKILLAQSDRVARRLRKQGFKGRTVILKLKTADFKTITRSSTLERPVNLSDKIYAEVTGLLKKERLGQKVRLVGVGVSNLEPSDRSGQLPLFDRRDAREKKWEKAEMAMDEITERFGHGGGAFSKRSQGLENEIDVTPSSREKPPTIVTILPGLVGGRILFICSGTMVVSLWTSGI